MKIEAIILSVGDELLIGQTLDTNAHWLSQELDKLGVSIKKRITLPDQEQQMLDALSVSVEGADIVIITGGLGPTKDDKTVKCLAKYFGVKLVLNQMALSHIKAMLQKRGRSLKPSHIKQVELPENAVLLQNNVGTASGMWFESNNTVIISLPGVPYEMRHIMAEVGFNKIKSSFRLPIILHKHINTYGVGESQIAAIIHDWELKLPVHIKLAYLPGLGEVQLRLSLIGSAQEQLAMEAHNKVQELVELLGDVVYSVDNESLECVIGKYLAHNNLTITMAESCTGGYLSHLITSVPGCSRYFLGSIIAYQNEIKIQKLGVSEATIANHGAVSAETVEEMANQVKIKFGSDIGLATSGVAGPSGGSPQKPVGTIWIACAMGNKIKSKKLQLTDDRAKNIPLTAKAVLNLLRLEFLSQ